MYFMWPDFMSIQLFPLYFLESFSVSFRSHFIIIQMINMEYVLAKTYIMVLYINFDQSIRERFFNWFDYFILCVNCSRVESACVLSQLNVNLMR